MENFDKKKLVLIDLHGTLSILNIIHMYTLYFYGSPDYKKREIRKFTSQKNCFKQKNYSGHAEYFSHLSEKNRF